MKCRNALLKSNCWRRTHGADEKVGRVVGEDLSLHTDASQLFRPHEDIERQRWGVGIATAPDEPFDEQ